MDQNGGSFTMKKSPKHFLFAAIGTACSLFAVNAVAGESNSDNRPAVETSTRFGMGFPVFSSAKSSQNWGEQLAFSVSLSQRIAFPRYSFFELEATTNFNGLGVVVSPALFRNDWMKIHAMEIGVYYNYDSRQAIAVPLARRDFDIIVGLGADFHMTEKWWLSVGWRANVPNPFSTVSRYGGYVFQITKDAFAESNLTVGMTYVL